MKRGGSARFLSSCCPSSCSSFPRVVYPRLRVISPFFPWFPPPIHRPPSPLAPRPLPRLALPPSPPPVTGFPTSPLVVVMVGVPTQQSHWGAGVSHHLRARRRIAPPPAFPLLIVSPPLSTIPLVIGLCPSSLGYALHRCGLAVAVVLLGPTPRCRVVICRQVVAGRQIVVCLWVIACRGESSSRRSLLVRAYLLVLSLHGSPFPSSSVART